MNNVTQITDIDRKSGGLIYLHTKFSVYRLMFNGDIVLLHEASWHTHRFGRAVVNRHPRWRLVGRIGEMPELKIGDRVPLMDDMGNFPKIKSQSEVTRLSSNL